MDDQTTTDTSVAESGAQDALPEQPTQEVPAEQSTSDKAINEPSQGEPESSLPQVDDKLQKYAETHGIALDSESTIKATKMAMDNQAEFTRKSQRASELEKATDSVVDDQVGQYADAGQPLTDADVRLARLELRDNIRTFFDENPDARKYEAQMAKLVKEKPHLMGDFDSLYAVARSQDTESLKSEAGREALEKLANKQRPIAPTGSAVTSSPATPKITRALMNEKLQSGDTAWLRQNREEINRMVAEGTLQ